MTVRAAASMPATSSMSTSVLGWLAQDGADGLGDVGRGEDGEGHLVEQRLKGVVVAAVDEGDVDGQLGQAFGGVDAGKTAADDDDARACGRLLSLGGDGQGSWYLTTHDAGARAEEAEDRSRGQDQELVIG